MKVKENLWVFAIVVGIAIATRLIPHYPNFTAIGAAALFSGAFFSRRIAFLVPVLALFISDLFLNNLIYEKVLPGGSGEFVILNTTTLWTYGALLLIVWMGSAFAKSRKIAPVAATSVAGSVAFFVISNFAVWMHSAMYPKTVEGLAAAYAAGIPFFGNMVAGDLFYVAILFGGLEVARSFAPGFAREKAQ